LGAKSFLDACKAPCEFGVSLTQGSFRIELEMARDVRHDEEEVAEFLRHLGRRAARATFALSDRGLKLGDFLLGLAENRLQ